MASLSMWKENRWKTYWSRVHEQTGNYQTNPIGGFKRLGRENHCKAESKCQATIGPKTAAQRTKASSQRRHGWSKNKADPLMKQGRCASQNYLAKLAVSIWGRRARFKSRNSFGFSSEGLTFSSQNGLYSFQLG